MATISGTESTSTPSQAAEAPAEAQHRRVRLPIALILLVGIAGLVLVAVTSVLYLGASTGLKTTRGLLYQNAALDLDTLEARIDGLLKPVADLSKTLAAEFASGRLDPRVASGEVFDIFRGALTALPQLEGAMFLTPEFEGWLVYREDDLLILKYVQEERNVDARAFLEDFAEQTVGGWGPVIFVPEAGEHMLTRIDPVHADDIYLGIVITTVTLDSLSDYVAAITDQHGPESRVFILYGPDRVLAHPDLRGTPSEETGGAGRLDLPRLFQVDHPVLSRVDPEDIIQAMTHPMTRGLFMSVVRVPPEDTEDVITLRVLERYGDTAWLLGVSFPWAEVTAEYARFRHMVIAGLVILAVAIVLALLVGRSIGRPVRRLAAVADQLRTLDFSAIEPLPDSPVRELSAATRAFNTTVSTLRWVEMYLPKTLLARLMRQRDSGAMASQERAVTVLFTDIVGFSRLSQSLGAPETAELLNDHFTLLTRCIEAEHGVVDKFIGDSVMAFWGAPDVQPDHAARALRAARSIQRAMDADSAARLQAGQPVVRIRVGLHSGSVVVGNIGASTRLNYTLVGETVNLASRLEALGKEIDDRGEAAVVLASAETASGAPPDLELESLGPRAIRGVEGEVTVYRLVGAPAPGS